MISCHKGIAKVQHQGIVRSKNSLQGSAYPTAVILATESCKDDRAATILPHDYCYMTSTCYTTNTMLLLALQGRV